MRKALPIEQPRATLHERNKHHYITILRIQVQPFVKEVFYEEEMIRTMGKKLKQLIKLDHCSPNDKKLEMSDVKDSISNFNKAQGDVDNFFFRRH